MYKPKTLFSSVLLTLCLLFLSNNVRAWERIISRCSGCGGSARAVKVDAAGDVIAIGSINGDEVVKMSKADGSVIWRFVAYGPDARISLNDLALDSNGDVFVVAHDTRMVIKVSGATGTEMWRATVEPSVFNAFQTSIRAVAIDRDNNVVTAGTISGLLNVSKLRGTNGAQMWRYEREGYATEVAVDSSGNVIAAGEMNRRMAVVKVQGSNGTELWQKEVNIAAPGQVRDTAHALTVGVDGSVIIAGEAMNTEFNKDFTVAKYSSDGTQQWVRQIDGTAHTNDDAANAVVVDKNGDVIAAGKLLSADSNISFFVTKLSGVGGTTIWAKFAQERPFGQGEIYGEAFTLSINAYGNVVAVGKHGNTSPRFTIVKFWGSTGGRAWRRSSSSSITGNDSAYNVVMDANSDVIAAGESEGTDGWQKFTVVKLRREDGLSYFEDSAPPVPEIVTKYAPLVYLHSEDIYRPGNPVSFINESSLNWFHEGGCDSEVIAARNSVQADRLGELSAMPYIANPIFPTINGVSCVNVSNIEFKTRDYTRPWDGVKRSSAENNFFWSNLFYEKEGFYLDLEDDAESREGMPDPVLNQSGAPLVYEYVPGKYVTYWFFYPYNLFHVESPFTGTSIPAQKHEGDWESISIQLDSNDTPVYVFFSQHHAGEFVLWSLVDKYEGTHPKVYSAKGSHGSFPSIGEFRTEFCPYGSSGPCALDRTNDTGPKWSTWKNLLKVEAQPWYGYGGAWGKVSTDPDVGIIPLPNAFGLTGAEYTGPLGPSKFKNYLTKWNPRINGQVKTLSGNGLSGVKIKAVDSQGNVADEATTCDGSTPITCVVGSYSLKNLVFGKNYSVVPSKKGYSFTPGTRYFKNLREMKENQSVNFTAFRSRGLSSLN